MEAANSYWDKAGPISRSMEKLKTDVLDKFVDKPTGKGKDSLTARINRKLKTYKEFNALSRKTHIPPAYFVYAVLVMLLLILVGFFERILCSLIATLYPLYFSIKTLQLYPGLKRRDGSIYSERDEKENVTQWLTYWVVYSILIIFESIIGGLVKKIPFYFFVKIVFLIFCFLPQFQLASVIYNRLISKLFNRYKGTIEKEANKFYRQMTKEPDQAQRDEAKKNLKKYKTTSTIPKNFIPTRDDDDEDEDYYREKERRRRKSKKEDSDKEESLDDDN